MSSVSEFMENICSSRVHRYSQLSIDASDLTVGEEQIVFRTSEPYRYIKIALLRKCVIEQKIYEPEVDQITQTVTIDNTQ